MTTTSDRDRDRKPGSVLKAAGASAISRKAGPRPPQSSPSTQARAAFNTPRRPQFPQNHPAMQARRGNPQQPEETPNVDLGPINAMAAAGTEAMKDIGKDVAKEALKGAAKGLLKGGTAGAAAGAVKGVVNGLRKNPKAQAIMIGALIICLISPLIGTLISSQSMSMTAAAISATDTSSEKQSAVASGVAASDVTSAVDYTDGSSIPWPIALAYQHQQGKALDLKAMLTQLDKADPSGKKRDLTAGSVYTSDSVARSTGTSSDSKDAAAAVATTWKTALHGLGLSDDAANAVYQAAVVWALGQVNGCGSTATSGPGTFPTLTAAQTANANTIMGMAKTYFPGDEVTEQKAATLAISVSLEENSLRSTPNADGSTTYVGLFQQIAAWGTVQQRLDPAYASATFFNTLIRDNPTWASMDQPTLTMQVAVQQFGTGLPTAQYQRYAGDLVKNTPEAAALVATDFQSAPPVARPAVVNPVPITPVAGGQAANSPVTCTAGGTVVDGTSQQIAQAIMPFIQSGAVSYYEPNLYGDQIPNIAKGTATANCVIAPNILRVVLAALQKWGTVTINDLNRKCYGSTLDAGFSPHFQGNAVDFGAVGGHPTKGADTWSIQLIHLADQYLPPGSGVGQSGCSRAHIDGLKNITRQFDDKCNHQHIDNGGNAGSIKGTF